MKSIREMVQRATQTVRMPSGAGFDISVPALGAGVAAGELGIELQSAVECLRDIAAMGRKAGSETAKNWLITHGFALEEGGYVPGKGFGDSGR